MSLCGGKEFPVFALNPVGNNFNSERSSMSKFADGAGEKYRGLLRSLYN